MSHHDGFSDKLIRDFLAKQSTSLEGECGNCETSMAAWAATEEQIDAMRARLVKALEDAKCALSWFDRGVVIRAMVIGRGWSFFDVSNLAPYDPKTYIHFVGTKEERDAIYGGGND